MRQKKVLVHFRSPEKISVADGFAWCQNFAFHSENEVARSLYFCRLQRQRETCGSRGVIRKHGALPWQQNGCLLGSFQPYVIELMGSLIGSWYVMSV